MNRDNTYEVRFRDGHVEFVTAASGTAAQFASSDWTEVSSVKPV